MTMLPECSMVFNCSGRIQTTDEVLKYCTNVFTLSKKSPFTASCRVCPLGFGLSKAGHFWLCVYFRLPHVFSPLLYLFLSLPMPELSSKEKTNYSL